MITVRTQTVALVPQESGPNLGLLAALEEGILHAFNGPDDPLELEFNERFSLTEGPLPWPSTHDAWIVKVRRARKGETSGIWWEAKGDKPSFTERLRTARNQVRDTAPAWQAAAEKRGILGSALSEETQASVGYLVQVENREDGPTVVASLAWNTGSRSYS